MPLPSPTPFKFELQQIKFAATLEGYYSWGWRKMDWQPHSAPDQNCSIMDKNYTCVHAKAQDHANAAFNSWIPHKDKSYAGKSSTLSHSSGHSCDYKYMQSIAMESSPSDNSPLILTIPAKIHFREGLPPRFNSFMSTLNHICLSMFIFCSNWTIKDKTVTSEP